MRCYKVAKQVAIGVEKLHARYQHGGDDVPLLHQDPALRLQLQARYPWLNGPDCIELLLLEEHQLVRISRGEDVSVAAGLCDFQPARGEPGTRRHVLRIAELGRRESLATKIGRCSQLRV